MSKIADEDMRRLIKQLIGVKLETVLAQTEWKDVGLDKNNTLFTCDKAMMIDQIQSSQEKTKKGLKSGVDNLNAKVAKEIPARQL